MFVAEDGGYNPANGTPNLLLRRPINPLAEEGGYRPPNTVPNLRLRHLINSLAEDGGYRLLNKIPNLHNRRYIHRSPKTEVIGARTPLPAYFSFNEMGEIFNPKPSLAIRVS